MYTEVDIKQIQELLHLQPTGVLDELTQAAIRNYQLINDLPVTDDIDDVTLNTLLGDDNLSSDLAEQFNASITNYYLPKNEYMQGPTNKEYIFLHHTAGWNNPYRVVDSWANDNRGRVGTQFVIGGINPRTGDDTYDGQIVKCFDDQCYAWHLGIGGNYVHTHSIGIELCHFGWVTQKGSDFYTYTSTRVDPKFVVELDKPFRGYKYWLKYSNHQLNSLRHLLQSLTDTHNISKEIGLKERLTQMDPVSAFEYFKEAKQGKVRGILSHTSVRPDKFDVFPQDELIDLIMNL